jgi:hypothetical protein
VGGERGRISNNVRAIRVPLRYHYPGCDEKPIITLIPYLLGGNRSQEALLSVLGRVFFVTEGSKTNPQEQKHPI